MGQGNSRKNLNRLMTAALAGLLVGGVPMVGCSNNEKKADGGDGGDAKGSDAGAANVEKHACKGMNDCAGKGGCKTADNECAGKNTCKGKGGCATTNHHACGGQNECAGLGGCKTGDNGCAGKNTCRGKGGCAVPVKAAE